MTATRVKFCGCVGWSDVELALEAEADAFGMIFAASPRAVARSEVAQIARRTPPSILPVGVFVNPSVVEVERELDAFPRMLLQFAGDEPPEFVARFGRRAIKVVHVGAETTADEIERSCERFASAMVLFDSKCATRGGGSGVPFAWERVARVASRRRVAVAGGLTPQNVAECVRRLRPAVVDVRTGIESGGRKDLAKMQSFVRAVRGAGDAS